MAKATDLQTRFNQEILPELKKELGIKNSMAVPKVTKVVINSGIGNYLKTNKKDFEAVVHNLSAIAGQKAQTNKAKKSVSNFKLREGDVVGVSVTLRGERMYAFLDKLVNVVFPRVRDFRGISPKSFDGNGNYSVGFREHTVFPEISPDEVSNLHGVQINISTTAKSNDEGRALLTLLGFPFKKVK